MITLKDGFDIPQYDEQGAIAMFGIGWDEPMVQSAGTVLTPVSVTCSLHPLYNT
jgi:hypothetical protein